MPGITDPTEEYFKDGLWGWDGTRWRKNPILIGYSDTLALVASNYSLAAGPNTLDTGTCPAGYIWVVTNIFMMYVGTVPTGITVYLLSGGAAPMLYRQLSPVSATGYDRQGWWVLEATDRLRCIVTGATLNDDLYLHVSGFAVAVT